MPPELRRKLRAAYPVFGAADIALRWLVPAALLAAVMFRSALYAVVAATVFVGAWIIRFRQFPRIMEGEFGISTGADNPNLSISDPLGFYPAPQMGTYLEIWPDRHERYDFPMVSEEAVFWCPDHRIWEDGVIEAWVSPGAFGGVNGKIEMRYGDHAWEIGDDAVSIIRRSQGSYGGRAGDLWEIRTRRAAAEGEYHELAVAALLPEINSWALVKSHLDGYGHFDYQDILESELDVALPD